MDLKHELDTLPPPLRDRLAQRGFNAERLVAWARTIGVDRDKRNRLPGEVKAPLPSEITSAPVPGTPEHAAFEARGLAALANGECALCVLAGGMATRMGGVVKALVDAVPGKTFLDLRLAEIDHISKRAGARVPLWLMTSEATDGPIRAALAGKLDPFYVMTFEQLVSMRLTLEGALFRDDHGEPSVYATGHGDLPEALVASGLLDSFLERGGKAIWIANIDNLGATIDPAILGFHLDHGMPVTVELVDKVGTDRGGVPVYYEGQPIITEEFRLPKGFDPAQIRVFNTNTFLAGAKALRDLAMEWTFVEVEKTIGDRKAVQFERLIGEMTQELPTRWLRVPREGEKSRFLPVKDVAELDKRRGEIEAVARDRGMI